MRFNVEKKKKDQEEKGRQKKAQKLKLGEEERMEHEKQTKKHRWEGRKT